MTTKDELMENKSSILFTGWQCPVCGNVMSPRQFFCLFCNKSMLSEKVIENLIDSIITNKEDVSKEEKPITSEEKKSSLPRATVVGISYLVNLMGESHICNGALITTLDNPYSILYKDNQWIILKGKRTICNFGDDKDKAITTFIFIAKNPSYSYQFDYGQQKMVVCRLDHKHNAYLACEYEYLDEVIDMKSDWEKIRPNPLYDLFVDNSKNWWLIDDEKSLIFNLRNDRVWGEDILLWHFKHPWAKFKDAAGVLMVCKVEHLHGDGHDCIWEEWDYGK